MSKKRQLSDRIETYEYEIIGNCYCGQPVIKVIGSNCTCWKNGDRYRYPDDNTASCIFRCEKCMEPIEDTFKPSVI